MRVGTTPPAADCKEVTSMVQPSIAERDEQLEYMQNSTGDLGGNYLHKEDKPNAAGWYQLAGYKCAAAPAP